MENTQCTLPVLVVFISFFMDTTFFQVYPALNFIRTNSYSTPSFWGLLCSIVFIIFNDLRRFQHVFIPCGKTASHLRVVPGLPHLWYQPLDLCLGADQLFPALRMDLGTASVLHLEPLANLTLCLLYLLRPSTVQSHLQTNRFFFLHFIFLKLIEQLFIFHYLFLL